MCAVLWRARSPSLPDFKAPAVPGLCLEEGSCPPCPRQPRPRNFPASTRRVSPHIFGTKQEVSPHFPGRLSADLHCRSGCLQFGPALLASVDPSKGTLPFPQCFPKAPCCSSLHHAVPCDAPLLQDCRNAPLCLSRARLFLKEHLPCPAHS